MSKVWKKCNNISNSVKTV